MERQDFGVAATAELHAGAMHAPTPLSIPSAQVISMQALVALLKGKPSADFLFDVLGGPERIAGALFAVPAHQPGHFYAAAQREFGKFLQQTAQGRQDVPLVFHCSSPWRWMSYNAALRAVRLGYRQVHWYRGGLDAWKGSGQPVRAGRSWERRRQKLWLLAAPAWALQSSVLPCAQRSSRTIQPLP